MERPVHHVWRQVALAWLAMVGIPVIYQATLWQYGFGRDSDMTGGVWELVLVFVVVMTMPMAAVAFGLFGPAAVVIDRIANGRTSRRVNLLIGVGLAVPALIATLILQTIMGWKGIVSFGVRASIENVIRHPEPVVLFTVIFVTGGAIVGLGLRHAGTAPSR